MVISVNTQQEYIPEVWGNKSAPDQIVIKHLAPTQALYNALIPKPEVEVRYDKNNEPEGSIMNLVIDNTKIVKEMVTSIENLTIEVDGKPFKITNGRELFGPSVPSVVSALVDEVGAYLQGLLSKKSIDVKN
jgi:hypothetical protein